MDRSMSSDPSTPELARRRLLAIRLFFGAGGALVVSAALPWVNAGGLISVHLSGGGILYVLLFAAAYAGAGYRIRQRLENRTLLIGAWVVDAWMAINVIVLFATFGGQGDQTSGVSPSIGVFAAGAGVVAGIVATVHLQRIHGSAG